MIEILVGVVSVGLAISGALAGYFKYKLNQKEAVTKFRVITSKDIDDLWESNEDIIDRLTKMDERMSDEIIRSREEHARIEKDYYDRLTDIWKYMKERRND